MRAAKATLMEKKQRARRCDRTAMLEKTLTCATLVLALSAAAIAAEPARGKVLIFNIPIAFEKSIIVEDGKKEPADRYEYYSFILPDTLARSLNASGTCEALKLDRELPVKDIGSDTFYREAERLGAEYAAHYILTGTGTVRGKKLTLELALVDIARKDFIAIIKESFETGAEMKGLISELTADIGQRIGPLYGTDRSEGRETGRKEETRKQEDTGRKDKPYPPVEKSSPFLDAYRAMEPLSFGIKTGRFFIMGPFSRTYEDSEYVNPYLCYGILSWIGVSAEADYLSAGNGDIITRVKSSLSLWAISLNGVFSYRFFPQFGVRLSAGGGASVGRIYLSGSDNPFRGLTRQKQSRDPYLNLAGSFDLLFRPVEIQFGAAYKAVIFKGTPLHLLTIFCGIGYHL
jgi:hypothetical protein